MKEAIFVKAFQEIKDRLKEYDQYIVGLKRIISELREENIELKKKLIVADATINKLMPQIDKQKEPHH